MRQNSMIYYFGASSGSSRSALKKLEEPDVMISYATDKNRPWDGIDRLFIDSGGYNFIGGSGGYGPDREYLEYLEEHDPDRFALRDYPCTPDLLDDLSRTVRDHQRKTTEHHKQLLEELEDREISGQPVSVIQGWTPRQYLEHIDQLSSERLLTDYVAIGSVCRNGRYEEIREIILRVAERLEELPGEREIHAFGVRSGTLKSRRVRKILASADSQSYEQRAQHGTPEELDRRKTWRESAYHYLQQRRRIETALRELHDHNQTTLSEIGEGSA